MTPGTHGSTYGGNPLAMSVGNGVLDIILQDGFLDNVKKISEYFDQELIALKKKYSKVISEVRGRGLLKGLKLRVDNTKFIEILMKYKMLVVKADYKRLLMNNLEEIFLSCELLNIARGRCEVKLLKVFKNNFNKKLLISSKKALMKAHIELDKDYFDNLNETLFKYSNQKSKKIKITFLMDKAVATDSEGVLSLDDDLETNLQEINFNIPIF